MTVSESAQSAGAKYRIGVDVGGTNTDAVLISLDPVHILASHKAPTTADITTGVTNAVRTVIASSGVSLQSIGCVIIGTTHFVNAIVQQSASLRRVAVVRLCGGPKDGFGRDLPPLIDFPPSLRSKIGQRTFFCNGGFQISGEEISPLDEAELKSIANEVARENLTDIVISGMYAPMNDTQELQAKEILSKRLTELKGSVSRTRITMSHQVSQLGFLARENAAILNATLRPLAERTIYGFQSAMDEIFKGVPYALYLTQNDGSILSAAEAIDLPIRTFNSGPTNSIRGGEFLWQVATRKEGDKYQDKKEPLVVIDIGGTTSDSGLLLANRLPRMSSLTSLVGGVRTNFALPAVESIGLGGGSIIRTTDNQEVTIGPDSVALELLTKAKMFGGAFLTTSDIAVTSNPNENHFDGLGSNRDRLADIPAEVVQKAQKLMREKLEDLIDRTKIQRGLVDVLIVGGGAIIVDTSQPFKGVRSIRTVEGGEVANAVGAAISRVSAVTDTVVDTSHQTVKQAQDEISQLTIQKAMRQGAKEGTVEVAELTILPIQYVTAKARIIAKAVGNLEVVSGEQEFGRVSLAADDELTEENTKHDGADPQSMVKQIDLETYRPLVADGQWILSSTDLEFIAAGCKVLGCGGGGDPYQEFLKAKSILEKTPGSIRVVSPSWVSEDALVGWTGCMGSPEVSMERLENDECLKAHDSLMKFTGSAPVSAFMALEIGGGNGVVNLSVSAQYGVPCVDADFMGRAYPTMYQVTPNVYGSSKGEALFPTAIASGDGTFMTMTESRSDRMVDKALRAACVEMGYRAGNAGPPKTGREVRDQAIHNTVSLAWWIGRAVKTEKNIADKAQAIINVVGGSRSAAVLGEGKIVSVERVLKTGHTYGVLQVEGTLKDGTGAVFKIPFKNENAFVEAIVPGGESRILSSVPDLIAVVDSETGAGLGTPEYKYGLKVVIIAIAASPHWTGSSRGLELGGPASMGFSDISYEPVGEYSKPRSVIDVFGSTGSKN